VSVSGALNLLNLLPEYFELSKLVVRELDSGDGS